jgi:TrmH family RNA methyltransferase
VRTRFVSSEQNPDIKRIKALRDRRSVRHAERLCIVEGPRFVADAARIDRPWLLVVSESRADSELRKGSDILIVPDDLFARLSDTTTPQGVQDPGNLGTMIRSAAALGATAVICASGTVDPFAPKVIRAAAAAHWHVPLMLVDSIAEAMSGVELLVTDGSAENPIDSADLSVPVAIAIGSEAHGVGSAIRSLPHVAVSIPMAREVESLNAGIAASIALYEAQRQRRNR